MATSRSLSHPSSTSEVWRPTLLRAGLVLVSFVFLWAGFRVGAEIDKIRAATFSVSWWNWIRWLGTLTLSGFAFGLAARVPAIGLRFRVWRVLLLAVLPLFVLFEMTLDAGPGDFITYMMNNFYILESHVVFTSYLFDAGMIAAVLLGVALAAGFTPMGET